MISAMEGMGTAMAKLALDAAALRHQAIAQNIANLHSPGYVPLGVSFDAQLAALRRGQAPGKPELVALDRAPGPRPQDADMEMVALSQNTIHYQALVKGIGTQLAILGAAISETRR
jgi:flagellar basal-body rod protein FlgB